MSFTMKRKCILTFSSLSAKKVKWQLIVQPVMKMENFIKMTFPCVQKPAFEGRKPEHAFTLRPRQMTTVFHYDDVIMSTIASQITNLTIVYSTVYSDADQRKHQSSPSLAFVWGIHRGPVSPVNSPHKWPVTRKMFPFDDVIMPYNDFKCISLYENWCTFIHITLKFVPKVPIDIISIGLDNGLVPNKDRPLSYPVMSQFTNTYALPTSMCWNIWPCPIFGVEFSSTLAPRQRYADLALLLLGIPPGPYMQWTKYTLPHWGRDKMADISQTTFSNVFSSMKMFEFRLKFHWSLFPRVQLTKFQHCFR